MEDWQKLRDKLAGARREAELASGDELAEAVARRVVEVLEGRLQGLRAKLLVETAQPVLEHLQSIAEQLREPLMTLCSLGAVETTDKVTTELDICVAMPLGSDIELSIEPDVAQVKEWADKLALLEADPLASIDRPKPSIATRKRGLFRR